MEISRRELALLVPALAAAAEGTTLEGKIYDVNAMAWRQNPNAASSAKAIFDGFTTRGQRLTMHATELAPGQEPHPPARQPHEEILIVQQGTLECTINGRTARLEPGAVVYSAFNDLKGWKNVGSGPAIYYVISLEEHK